MSTDPQPVANDPRYPGGIATSGKVADVTWWSRQLTGAPHIVRGYIEVRGVKSWCGHNHRKGETARACAMKLATAEADRPDTPAIIASQSPPVPDTPSE